MELFYHHEGSPYVRKVLIVCDELNLEPIEHKIDMQSQEAMKAYSDINPNMKFPALRDDAFILWESNAIIIYLAQASPDHDLHGVNRQTAALVNQWLFWEIAHFATTVNFLVNLRLRFLPKPVRSEGDLLADSRRLFRVLDNELRQHRFLTGSRPRLPDFAVAADLTYANEADLPLEEFANLSTWFESIRRRASWQVTEERKNNALAAFGIKL